MIHHLKNRGTSLLELLIVIGVMAPFTIVIMANLSQARSLRGRSADSMAALVAAHNALLSLHEPVPGTTSQTLQLSTRKEAILTLTTGPSLHSDFLQTTVSVELAQPVGGFAPITLTQLTLQGNQP